MQDALTLAFDITAVAAVAYLSTEFCLGLAERVNHPKPAASSAPPTATVTSDPIASVPAVSPIAAPATPAPMPGAVQPLPNLSAVPKAEPEYVPLESVHPTITRPNPVPPLVSDD